MRITNNGIIILIIMKRINKSVIRNSFLLFSPEIYETYKFK